MAEIQLDDHGHPVMFAIATPPEKISPSITTEDPAPPSSDRPSSVDQGQWARRMDAVREAAREFEQFTSQDVKEWLKGRTNRELSQQDIDGFLADVRAQQVHDLVDALDQRERGALRGRRHVRVNAPKGYVRKLLNALTSADIQDVARRLRAKGWTDQQIKVLGKRLPDKHAAIAEALDEPGPVVIF